MNRFYLLVWATVVAAIGTGSAHGASHYARNCAQALAGLNYVARPIGEENFAELEEIFQRRRPAVEWRETLLDQEGEGLRLERADGKTAGLVVWRKLSGSEEGIELVALYTQSQVALANLLVALEGGLSEGAIIRFFAIDLDTTTQKQLAAQRFVIREKFQPPGTSIGWVRMDRIKGEPTRLDGPPMKYFALANSATVRSHLQKNIANVVFRQILDDVLWGQTGHKAFESGKQDAVLIVRSDLTREPERGEPQEVYVEFLHGNSLNAARDLLREYVAHVAREPRPVKIIMKRGRGIFTGAAIIAQEVGFRVDDETFVYLVDPGAFEF